MNVRDERDETEWEKAEGTSKFLITWIGNGPNFLSSQDSRLQFDGRWELENKRLWFGHLHFEMLIGHL